MISRFGSSSEMVIRQVEENGVTYALAIDEKGLYLTSDRYLDRNIADPHRYATAGRADMPARLAALQLDYAALTAAHQHRVKKLGEGEVRKKVNPLKASKRSMKG
ncbi:hypothetical protein QUW15_01005 [Desulfovibrio piger]|nr:hypothetical protein [Desulfovibrio piger]